MPHILILTILIFPYVFGQCPPNFDGLSNGNCYILNKNHKFNWFQAQEECLAMNSTLVELDSEGEKDLVLDYLETKVVQNDVWLGYLRSDGTRLFRSAFLGLPPTYENWLDGNPDRKIPNPSCALMDSDYGNDFKWKNFFCIEHKAYALCEMNYTQIMIGAENNWTPWSPCNSTCYPGYQSRRKTCSDPLSPSNCSTDDVQVRMCANFCPSIVSSEDYSSTYEGSHALSNECERPVPNNNYWLSPDRTKNANMILDLGLEVNVNKVMLKNTYNGGHRDRGTNTFHLEVSTDNSNWETVLKDSLPDVRSLACDDVPVKEFVISARARYVKFVMETYYGHGGGLQYIGFM